MGYLPDLNSASANLSAFLDGVMGVPFVADDGRLDDSAYPVLARTFQGLLSDIEVKIPLDSWNGTAALKPTPAHVFVLRFNVNTQEAHVVKDFLSELDTALSTFLSGNGRLTYDPLGPIDERGFATAAFVGFGPGFFNDANGNPGRFGISPSAVPAQLNVPVFSGDENFGHNSAQSQTDLYICLQTDNRALLLEGVGLIFGMPSTSAALDLVDMREAAKRDDGRNMLGFVSGSGNPTIDTIPAVDNLILTDESEEVRSLTQGSYITVRHYDVDIAAWEDLSVSQQEELIGCTKDEGTLLTPAPVDSVFGNLSIPTSPLVLRRGADYASIKSDGQTDNGLVYQVFQRQPEEQAIALHNDYLLSSDQGDVAALLVDGLLTPVVSGSYFAPHGNFAEYPGQQFFQPDLYDKFFNGLRCFAAGNYNEALQLFSEVEQMDPSFMWVYGTLSECYHDLDQLPQARQVLERAALQDDSHYVYLEQWGWQHYLEGNYQQAVDISTQAVSAYYEDSHRSYPLHDLGAALLELGQAEEAELAFRRAVARVNLVTKNCFGLGNALDAQGRINEAQTIYARTIEVAQYLIERNRVSPRDVGTVLDLTFINYSSPRSQDVVAQVNQLLDDALASGQIFTGSGD